MAKVFDAVRRVWRDHIAGPTLRTYDASLEELGGAPWRAKPEATDRWFLPDRPDRPKSLSGVPPVLERPATLDTGAFLLKKPWSDASKLALLGSATLGVIGVMVIALGGHASARRAELLPVALPAAAVVASAPIVTVAPPLPPASRAAAPAHAPAPARAPAHASAAARALAAAPAKHVFVGRHRRR